MFESATYLALLHLSEKVVKKIFNWHGMGTNQSEEMPGCGAEAGLRARPIEDGAGESEELDS